MVHLKRSNLNFLQFGVKSPYASASNFIRIHQDFEWRSSCDIPVDLKTSKRRMILWLSNHELNPMEGEPSIEGEFL